MPARVSILLKSRAFLTCFRACFLPGRAKDLSVPRYFAKSTNYEAPRYAIYSLSVTRPPQQQTPNAIYVTYTTVTEPNTLPAVSHSAHHRDCLATEVILNLTPGYLDQQSPAHGIDDRRIGVRCQTGAYISLLRSIQTESNDAFLERPGMADPLQSLSNSEDPLPTAISTSQHDATQVFQMKGCGKILETSTIIYIFLSNLGSQK